MDASNVDEGKPNKPPSRRRRGGWIIPAAIAVVIFVGQVASNLVAADLDEPLKPYRLVVWAVFGIALAAAVGMAIAEVQRQEEAPAADAPHQLPPPPEDLTGREAELKELRQAVERGGVTISGLRGLGGVGKTALALKLAEELRERYPDGQLLVEMRGTDPQPLTPAEAMGQVIRAYDPLFKQPDSEAELRGIYRTVLDRKRALLLLDNAADHAQVLPLVPPQTCLLLVTSRRHFTLPGLYAKNLDVLRSEDARKLLLRIASRIGRHAETIAQLCGYLPLALRAAGSLVRVTLDLAPGVYAEELRAERTRLERIGMEGVEIGVEASLNLSYQRLGEEMARAFRLLAVFPGTFDAAAEEVVCEDEGHGRLSELVRYSLVEWSETARRYSLHDLVRVFAGARLEEEERGSAQRRHAAHYEGVLRAAQELYKKGGESITHGLGLFDLEWGNIQAGQAWAAGHAGEDDEAARLCSDYPDAGAYCLNLRQHSRDWIRWLEAALAGARKLKDRGAEGAHQGNLGLAYAALGDARKAIEFYEKALVIDREIGDRHGESKDLGNIGNAYHALGDARKAIEYHEQALVIAREIGDRQWEGGTLGNLGSVYLALGDARQAIEFYEQQLVITREIGDRRGEGTALGGLGIAYKNLGDARQAIEYHEQALVIAREIGNRWWEGGTLGNLGLAYAALGDARHAIEFYEQQLVITREIGDRRGEALGSWNLGLAYEKEGDLARAIAAMQVCVEYEREIGHPDAEKDAARVEELRGRLKG